MHKDLELADETNGLEESDICREEDSVAFPPDRYCNTTQQAYIR